jgi:hypothetical protein
MSWLVVHCLARGPECLHEFVQQSQMCSHLEQGKGCLVYITVVQCIQYTVACVSEQ